MHPLAVGAAIVAAVIHVWFFVLESIRFMRPAVWRRFGLGSEAEAAVVRSFAFNQGFYNLFLAIGVGLGLGLAATGDVSSGRAIVLFACGSMIAATRRLGIEYLRTVSQATSEQVLWWYRSMLEVLTARGDWPQRTMLDEIRSLSADLIRTLRQREEDF